MSRSNKKRRLGWIVLPVLLISIFAWSLIAGLSIARLPPAQIIAHRGACRHAPENTLIAYEKAIEMGVDGVECDILVTADGEVVLSHDDTIDRCSGGTGRVDEMTFAQLRELDFGAWFGEGFAGTLIPTLDEFLDVVQDVGLILIELKNGDGDIAAKAVEAVQKRNLMGKVIFQSFDMEAIQACKAIDANAYIALLYNGGSEYDKAARDNVKEFCKEYSLDGLHPQYASLSSKIVRECAEIGVEVRTWTPNDTLFLGGGNGQGARGLITDNIELAYKLLELPAFARRALALAGDVVCLVSPLLN